MAIIKKLTDPIRIKILSAMTKKRAVSPNIREIKKQTGFHRATIKSSIQFMEDKNFINGYRPLLNPSVVGYKLLSSAYLQADITNKSTYKLLINQIDKDKSILHFSEVISDSNANIALYSLSKNIEDYHNKINKNYYSNIPNIFEFIKKKSIFYLSEPTHKHRNEIDVLIDLLKQAEGIK